jgi:hypothetical protein
VAVKEQPRYVKIAPRTLVVVGSLAGTGQPHPFLPDAWTGSCCLACFAPCDAVQHTYARLPRLAEVGS